jgi:hypothetical protein
MFDIHTMDDTCDKDCFSGWHVEETIQWACIEEDLRQILEGRVGRHTKQEIMFLQLL